MAKPTKNDWENFEQIPLQTKAKVLEAYLYGIPGQPGKPNMETVAEYVFKKATQSEMQMISCITRCYGFEGQNGSYYKRKNLNLISDDFLQFVKAYPRGCPSDYPQHEIMDEFMRGRDAKRAVNPGFDENNQQEAYHPQRQNTGALPTRGNKAPGALPAGGSTDPAAVTNRKLLVSVVVILALLKLGNPKAVSGWIFYVIAAAVIALVIKVIRRRKNAEAQRLSVKERAANILSGIAWFAAFFHLDYRFLEAGKSNSWILITFLIGAVGGIAFAVGKKEEGENK